MLDDPDLNDADSSNSTPADSAPTTPVRRRRAASRPAGPPAEKPVVTQTVPAEQVQAASAETAEAPKTRTSRSKAAATTAEPTEQASAEPTQRPARRRATRAQGAAAAEQPPAPSEQDAAEPIVAAEASVEDGPAKAPARKRTTTRRATKTTKAAPQAEEAQAQESADPAQAPVAELLESAPTRRTRSRRVATAVADPFQAPDPESVLQNLAATIAGQGVDPVDLAELPVEKAPDLETKPTRRRATRSGRAKQAPEAEQAGAADQESSTDPQSGTEQVVDPTDAEQVTGEESSVDPELTDHDADQTEDEDAQVEDAEQADSEDDADESDAEDSDGDEDSASDEEDEPREGRRRRRRRGGRRRRRSGAEGDAAGEDGEADSEGDTDDEDEESSTEDAGDSSDTEDAAGDSGRRRRRRRRRRGEDTSGAEDDPSDVVVRVREPRRTRSGNDEITSIEGSTRMAAKKMRRQEGRAAGRRRAPILSEAEFLARRESVERRMIVRQREDYTQLAVLEDGVLVEHYVDRASSASMIGNIYLGRVQNVLPGMEAAFIDIGRGRNAVLYAGEIDWETYGVQGEQRKVEQVLKSGQTVLVQVSKDPVGAKGARLTSHISIPGRYLVYSPGGHLSGISRKLADTERNRLKEILGHLIDEKASVIVRTAAEGVSEDELVRDVNRLKTQWEIIEKKVKQGSGPTLLYGEPDLTVRTVRDLFTEDFASLAIQGNGSAEDAYEAISGYIGHVAPHLADRITRWDAEAEGDIFAAKRIDQQISKALERKVFLPSGGSLIIDRTEAMTVIDVNTGRFTGTSNNLEATVTSNNLEAAEEVVRQLRLRDIGGIIVIDFIDMVLPANRDLLIRRLVECLSRDRTRHQVAEVTSLGLVQLTRKKIGTGLAEAFTEQCDHCGGRGYHRFDEPVESQAPSDGGDRGGRHSGGGHTQGSNHSNGGNGNGGNSNGGGRNRGGRRRGGRSGQSSED